MDRAHEARDSNPRLAVQRRPHGDGLRPQGLHPRRRRHEQRREPILDGGLSLTPRHLDWPRASCTARTRHVRGLMAMVFVLEAVSVAGGIYVILFLVSVCLSPKAM